MSQAQNYINGLIEFAKRISGQRTHVGDSEFDLDNDDATLVAGLRGSSLRFPGNTLAEHLISHHGVTDGDLFNHSYSFTVLQLAPHDLGG